MVAAAAEFHDVTKTYRTGLFGRQERHAISGINLTINAGEVFALLGPNRAGKTTLIKLLLTLARPTSGQITRLGQPVTDRSTLARIGYVHENHTFPKYLTAAGLLEYYGALTLLPHPLVRERVPMLLERVGLADRAHDIIGTFSKGMIQRLGMAQALLNDADLLVLDEPSEGLDLSGRQLMAEIVRDYRSRGKTVILVSHVLGEVEPLCDRAGVIVGGKLAFLGSLAELKQAQPLEVALKKLYAQQVA